MKRGALGAPCRHGPLQMLHSFEGLVNGRTSAEEVHISWRPATSYDLSDFEERVRRELARLRDLGAGGIVVNVGYDDYLDNDEAWQRFVTGVRAAVELGLRVWIYDEDGYPSGAAGGKVLRGHPELEAVGLKKLTIANPEFPLTVAVPEPRATLYALAGLKLDGPRFWLPLSAGSTEATVSSGDYEAVEAYFVAPLYEGTHAVLNIAAARRYPNLLDRRVVSRFLKLTYVRYFDRIPEDLRPHVEAFFPDEPSLMAFALPLVERDPFVELDPVNWELPIFPSVPWSAELELEFLNEHRYALRPHVDALFSGSTEAARQVRRDFWETVSRVYAANFAAQAAQVCDALGMELSGHFLAEETIAQHVALHGDLLRALQHLHRPGLDLLTCNRERFPNHIITHKVAQPAAFLASHRRVMSETSDYSERYEGERKGAPLRDILCTIAMQYLLGVRDFCIYFDWRAMPADEYQAVCEFIRRLLEVGGEARYQPEAGLYFPIEQVWEHYTPVCPLNTDLRSPELAQIDALTTETCKRLFLENVQYVLCERHDIARLAARGIRTLLYYGPGQPDSALRTLCDEVGVQCRLLGEWEGDQGRERSIVSAEAVAYATYEGFVFAVNCGPSPSEIALSSPMEAAFPHVSTERTGPFEHLSLGAYQCAFLFP